MKAEEHVQKLVDARCHGQCRKCHKYRELRACFNSTLSEITLLCDFCFDCPMDMEALDLIFEKAGVEHPDRSGKLRGLVEAEQRRMFQLTRIWPEED